MRKLSIRPMEYYCDRADNGRCVEISEDILRNKILLWGTYYFESAAENIFDIVFETTDRTYHEYLFAMDYLSTLLSAYRKTNDLRYQDKFLEIVTQFFTVYDRGTLVFPPEDDLITCAQTLMFIKSFSLIQYEETLKEKIIALLYTHALYCYDDQNHCDNGNHGLFTDMALLHLSVLFESLPEAAVWKQHAVERVQQLFSVAFFEDGFNNEGSLTYFQYNLHRYQEIIDFCNVYKIAGLTFIQGKLSRNRNILQLFAHKDDSFPVIGDGSESPSFPVAYKYDPASGLWPKGGICVFKTENMYLTFKCKADMQDHTHVDDSSVTARYENIDLVLDCGQYNYDRYHPINRYLRTSGGHSGIFPLFVDGLSLREYLKRRNKAGIEQYNFDGTMGKVSGGYELDEGAIQVRREITVEPNQIKVQDSWRCASPQNIRQRFVLPKEMLPNSKFTASKQLFETTVGTCKIKYQIQSGCPATTTVNFGVLSRKYREFETTVLLDTVAENTTQGKITAILSIQEMSGNE